MRRPKDRDFVETEEGFLFCLVGYVHPADRYTAYLKYTPAASGRWARGGSCYRRELPYYHVRNVAATVAFLEAHHPRYVWVDPVSALKFSFVPRDAVATYYVPEARLAEIVAGPADALEADVQALAGLLAEAAAVPLSAFGITGSILLGLHDPAFSDIDLLVYGGAHARSVKGAVAALRERSLQDLTPEQRARWRADTASRFSLAPADVQDLQSRRWNYFLFNGRYVSVHPTREDGEITEESAARRFRSIGHATIEAEVADATESLVLPARYRLAGVSCVEGGSFPIVELISFEGLYGNLADAGDRIRARGAVEQGDDGSCRLVVGAASLADGGFALRTGRRSGAVP